MEIFVSLQRQQRKLEATAVNAFEMAECASPSKVLFLLLLAAAISNNYEAGHIPRETFLQSKLTDTAIWKARR